jgi:hypothetical protein
VKDRLDHHTRFGANARRSASNVEKFPDFAAKARQGGFARNFIVFTKQLHTTIPSIDVDVLPIRVDNPDFREAFSAP